ncbi:MAG: M28 family peptidase [Chitinophagaceae bacterium]|nr:M28 family peptidase [Chitinophagaceae bacterium]
MKKHLLVAFLFATILVSAQDKASRYAPVISTKGLKEKLTIIAGAEMEGRETGMPGERKAAAYIEEQFKKIGLQPGNGNSYQMNYPVYRDEVSDKSLRVNGRSFEWDKQYFFNLGAVTNGTLNIKNIVFAGHGIVDSVKSINDLAGLDVKDKIVMVLDGDGGIGSTAGSSFAKMNALRRVGAAGMLMISSVFPKTTVTATIGNIYFRQSTGSPFTMVTISPEIASALLGRTTTLSMNDLKAVKKGTYTAELQLMVAKKTTTLETSNVIGVLPGTDKKDEYVFLTAHHDHLGMRNGQIYYGADDDGSGTVSVIQMAEAFAAAVKKGDRPRRSIAFMTVSGEEKGLWGSEYYSDHPIYPLDKTTVNLNIDMVGRVDTERQTADSLNYVYVIGHDKLSSELAPINEGANNKYTKLTLDYKFDDPKDVNRIYYRSDHYNFARKGVPILFFYDGMLKADYHKVSDTVDKINFELMQKRVQMIYYTAWDIANRDNMLKRDIPLSMPGR